MISPDEDVLVYVYTYIYIDLGGNLLSTIFNRRDLCYSGAPVHA